MYEGVNMFLIIEMNAEPHKQKKKTHPNDHISNLNHPFNPKYFMLNRQLKISNPSSF